MKNFTLGVKQQSLTHALTHYIIDVVLNILRYMCTVCIYTGHFTLQQIEILESDNIIKMAELTRLRDVSCITNVC
jgi:hypothetical protein